MLVSGTRAFGAGLLQMHIEHNFFTNPGHHYDIQASKIILSGMRVSSESQDDHPQRLGAGLITPLSV